MLIRHTLVACGLLVWMWLQSASVWSEQSKPLVFATFPIPLMVESETKGVFIELTQELIRRLELNAVIRMSPPQRSINDLVHGRVNALFPALDAFFVDSDVYTRSSEIIYIKEDFVFTRSGDTRLSRINDLKDKVVGLTRGYPYAPDILRADKFKLDFSLTDEICVQKLVIGRLDAFIAEERSGIQAFTKQNLTHLIQYDPAQPVSQQQVYYATGRNGDGKALAELIAKGLLEMKQDGSFNRIMAAAKLPAVAP